MRNKQVIISNSTRMIDNVNSHNIDSSIQHWIEESSTINTDILRQAMQENKLECSVYGSCYPQQSELVSACIMLTHENRKIRSADFIKSVIMPLRKSFTAELCRMLAICKVIEYCRIRFGLIQRLIFKAHSDCSSALNFLSYQPKIISNNSKLHQIKREILLILQNTQLQPIPSKAKAH